MKLLLFATTFFIMGNLYSQTHKYYFNASTGNDNNTTLQAQNPATPWQTITKFNSFANNFVAGDSIFFERAQTFSGTLAPTKSGTAALPIVISAHGSGAKPIISGLFSIPSWTSIGGNKWTAVVASAQTTLNLLLINGAYQAIGRTPKANASTPSWSSGGYYQYQSVGGIEPPAVGASSTIVSNQIAAEASHVGGEVVIRSYHYIINRGIITAQNATTVTYTQEAGGAAFPNFLTPTVNFGFFFQNEPNCLTATGDWCYTSGTKTVTIFNTVSPTNVSVTVNQNNVTMSGVSFVTFDNLDFQGSNLASVSMNNCNHITFQNDSLVFHGTNGLQCSNSTSNTITVNNCVFDHINNNGIDANSSTNWLIQNNTFTNIAQLDGIGLSGDGQYEGTSYLGNNSVVKFNSLANMGFNGIMYRGDGVTVQNNFVNNFCLVKDDGGGIYSFQTNGVAKNVIGNIVINGKGNPNGTTGAGTGGAIGIYFDGSSQNVNCQNNSVANCQELGILFNDPIAATITGNTVFNTSTAGINGELQINNNGGFAVRKIINTNNIYVSKAATNEYAALFYSPSVLDVDSFFVGGRTDSNCYARPINQNAVIVKREASFLAWTIAQWQAFIKQDAHSFGTPKVIPDTTSNNIIFKYNATNSAVSVPLTGTWEDMKGVNYTNSITLQPYSSAVLLFVNANAPPLSATVTINSQPLCFGGTGSITINATGGVSPYTYNISGGGFSSTNTFSGLSAGTYVFQVKDAAGTIVSVNGTIVQPSQIVISQVSGTITINGQTTTTTVTANGGTGTLSYKLDAGSFQSSNVFTGVAAGTHTITVRDANNCTNTLSYTITQPSVLALTASAAKNPLTCNADTTHITATASGATPPYTYNINGGAFSATNVFTGLGAGSYTITAKDAAGASTTTTVTITQPTAITISESNPPITVNGNTTTVTITASGGTGTLNYSLDGTTYQASNVFTNIPARNWTAFVKDANGCIKTLNFTITQPSVLQEIAAITTAIPCNGSSGVITATGSGGTPPYQYRIGTTNPYSTTNTFSVTAGTYQFFVLDAGGAVTSVSQTITQPSQISLSLVYTSAPTSVTMNASGGTAPLTYSLDNSAFQSGNVFSNVGAGNHTAVVKDANGCTTTQIFNVGSVLGLTLSVGAIACNGFSTTATVQGINGNAPYTYLWSNNSTSSTVTLTAGTWSVRVTDNAAHIHDTTFVITQPSAISMSLAYSSAPTPVTITSSGGTAPLVYSLDGSAFQASNVFTNVNAGNHTAITQDANGCSISQVFNVGSGLGISLSVGVISCNGLTTTATASGVSGTAPYTFTWSNGGTAATQTLSAGTWNVQVMDAVGHTHDTTFVITQPSAISMSVAYSTAPTTVTVTASGGVAPLQYKLDAGAYQGSNTFASVLAGTHTVTVKDNNGCTTSQTFTVVNPTLNLTLTVGSILCNGGMATATIQGVGGVSPYNYLWSNNQTPATQQLTAGTWNVKVTDNVGQSHDTTFVITQPAPMVITPSLGTILTNGGTCVNTFAVSGGTPTYHYSTDGVTYQLSNSFTLGAGNYTIYVKDANNCIQTQAFTLSQPGQLIIGISRGAAISCYNGTQAITVTGSGGTTPYTGTGTFNKLAGTYTFQITDKFGAVADTIITVTQPTQITINVTTGTIITNGGNTTVTATASGGTGSLQYQLDGGAYQGTGNFSGVLAGSHTITVKDANNCTNVNTFSISQPGVLLISVAVTTPNLTCYGNTSAYTLSGSGGTAPLTYNRATSGNLGAGTWLFEVTDANGAKYDSTITITQPPLISLTQVVQFPNTIAVYGGTTDSIYVYNSGGTPFANNKYQYSVDGGGYATSDSSAKYNMGHLTGGNHTVTIKDANGCTQTYSFSVAQPAAPTQNHTKKKGTSWIKLNL